MKSSHKNHYRRAIRPSSGWAQSEAMRRDGLAVQSAIENRLEQLSMEIIPQL